VQPEPGSAAGEKHGQMPSRHRPPAVRIPVPDRAAAGAGHQADLRREVGPTRRLPSVYHAEAVLPPLGRHRPGFPLPRLYAEAGRAFPRNRFRRRTSGFGRRGRQSARRRIGIRSRAARHESVLRLRMGGLDTAGDAPAIRFRRRS